MSDSENPNENTEHTQDPTAEADANTAPHADAPAEAPQDNAPTREEFDAMRDAMLRAVAEADNVRKQTAKEIADSRKYAVTNFARDIISVADNFERALKALPEDAKAQLSDAGQSLLTGVEMTEKELHAALSRHGVEPIPAEKGTKFDPNIHQAAAQIPSEMPKDTIAEVIQAGWRMADRTLRPAMVAVSAGGLGAQAEPAAPPQDAPTHNEASPAETPNETPSQETTAHPTTADNAASASDTNEPGNRIDTTI